MKNIETRKVAQFKGHDAGIYAISLGQKPETFFTAGTDKVVAEWNTKSGKGETFSIKLNQTIYSLSHLTLINRLIIGTANGGIHWVDLTLKKELFLKTLHQNGVFDLKPFNHQKKIVASSADGSFSVWDTQSAELLYHIKLKEQKIRSINFNLDESLLLACGSSGYIYVFETSSFKEIGCFKAHELAANIAIFHPKKRVIISGGRDAYLRIWNLDNNFELVGEIPAHNFAIYQIAVDQTNSYFATASRDKTIKIWDLTSLDLLKRIERIPDGGHVNSVNNLMWHPYENQLISISDDRSIIIWEIIQN